MSQITTRKGVIKSLIYADSKGEKKAISCKMFLKGDFNAWNETVRKVAHEEQDKKQYAETAKFFEDLKSQAKVSEVNDLAGAKIEATFDGDKLQSFIVIPS